MSAEQPWGSALRHAMTGSCVAVQHCAAKEKRNFVVESNLRFSQVYPRMQHVEGPEALAIARRAASRGDLYFSGHALERMQERLVTHADVEAAIGTSDVAVPSDDGPNRWVLCGGIDLDDCGLRVVVALDDGVVLVTIVTVYPP